jgi:hypothetical protein
MSREDAQKSGVNLSSYSTKPIEADAEESFSIPGGLPEPLVRKRKLNASPRSSSSSPKRVKKARQTGDDDGEFLPAIQTESKSEVVESSTTTFSKTKDGFRYERVCESVKFRRPC